MAVVDQDKVTDRCVFDGRAVVPSAIFDEQETRDPDTGLVTEVKAQVVDVELLDAETGEVVDAWSRGHQFVFQEMPDGAPMQVTVEDLGPDAVYQIRAVEGESLRHWLGVGEA